MNNNFSKGFIPFFVKFGIVMFGLGFFFATLIFILSFTRLQQFWVWYNWSIKLSSVLIVGGVTFVLAFGTWVMFESRTRKTSILNILFNYSLVMFTFSSGIIYLVGSILLDNVSVAFVGLRCYVIGIFMLIVRNTVVKFLLSK